jgi:hypothetical protein
MEDLSDDDRLDLLCALLDPEAADESMDESMDESVRVQSEPTASFAEAFAFDDSPEKSLGPSLASASNALKAFVASRDPKEAKPAGGVRPGKTHRSTSEVTREYRRSQDFNAAISAASKTSSFAATSEGPRVQHKLDERTECEAYSGLRLRDRSVSKACEPDPNTVNNARHTLATSQVVMDEYMERRRYFALAKLATISESQRSDSLSLLQCLPFPVARFLCLSECVRVRMRVHLRACRCVCVFVRARACPPLSHATH